MRGPADAQDQHESQCYDMKKQIGDFYGPHPLGKLFTSEFKCDCDVPMPQVPECEILLAFLDLEPSEITPDDLRGMKKALKNRKDAYDDLCSALSDSVKKEKIRSRRSSVGNANAAIQVNFKYKGLDRPLTDQQSKIVSEMTSANALSDEQFRAIVEYLKSLGHSNFTAIFECFSSKHGSVDVKQICGHLDCLYLGTDAPNFGDEPNSKNTYVEQPSKYIPMSTKSIVNSKTTTSMPQGQRWSHLKTDPTTLIQEVGAIEDFIRRQNLDGRSIDEDGFTVMKVPESQKFIFALVARSTLNLWLAKHLLKRFTELVVAMGASELEETQCKNLMMRYEEFFRSDAVDYRELPHHEKVTVKSYIANGLQANLSIGVNFIIDLANIFNQADIRENVSRLALYIGNLVLKPHDNTQNRFIETEKERLKLLELPWQEDSNSIADAFGISTNPISGIPKMLETSDPAMYFFLHQAYNYRGPNNGIGGIASARKALEQSIVKICGPIRTHRQPLEDVPTDKLKLVFEDFIQAPSAHGLPIDPDITVDRSNFTNSSSRNGTGYAAAVQSEHAVGLISSTPKHQHRLARADGGGDNKRHHERGRSTSKSEVGSQREQSIARKLKAHEKSKSALKLYDDTRKRLGESFQNVESEAQLIVGNCKDLDSSYQKKFVTGPFKLNGKKVAMPLRPYFDDPGEFWSWHREPKGVKPTLNLYIRFCVLADMFRLFKDNMLSTYGEAYRQVYDPNWGDITRKYASNYPVYKFVGASKKDDSDESLKGGGGGGGGRKGSKKN